MRQLEQVFKVLADSNRMRILKLLEKRKMCVCELASILGITQPSVSRHLKKLKRSQLINEEQDSFWTNYYLARSKNLYVRALLVNLKSWLNNDKRISDDLKKAEKINRHQLCRK